MMKVEVRRAYPGNPSSFDIPCSIFDILFERISFVTARSSMHMWDTPPSHEVAIINITVLC